MFLVYHDRNNRFGRVMGGEFAPSIILGESFYNKIMDFRLWIFILCLSSAFSSVAQDERFFRDLYHGGFFRDTKVEENKNYSFQLSSPLYMIDLNFDGRQEGIGYQQKDGESWLNIVDDQGGIINKFKLAVYGNEARPFRINWRTLAPEVSVLVISFYEGSTHYLEFHATARFYFIAIEKNDLKKMKLFSGPAFFEEKLDYKKNYYRRAYQLDFKDLNGDGVRDVIVRHNSAGYAYLYAGDGQWIANR
jgi:hypothetical protein